MAKAKRYQIITTSDRGSVYKLEGTLSELIQSFSYTLECGASWQHEKGRKKINREPKTIKSLIMNLYNAKNNSARNGYGGESYDYVELK